MSAFSCDSADCLSMMRLTVTPAMGLPELSRTMPPTEVPFSSARVSGRSRIGRAASAAPLDLYRRVAGSRDKEPEIIRLLWQKRHQQIAAGVGVMRCFVVVEVDDHRQVGQRFAGLFVFDRERDCTSGGR